MGDYNTQKMINSNETHLTVEISYLIISEGLSFNIEFSFHSKKIHISSKGKSNTWVISSLLFDFLYADINIS